MAKISKITKICAIVSAIGFLVVPTSSMAESAACGERGELIKALKQRYKEVPVAAGISQKNTEAFEIFASEQGTWTVVMTTSTGMTCIMAAGHSWKDLPKIAMGPLT